MNCIISGKKRESQLEEEIINPYTGELLDRVALAGAEEAEEAIAKTLLARKRLSLLNTFARAKILRSIAQKIEVRRDELARQITSEVAKPIKLSLAEVARCVSTFFIAAEECERLPSEIINLESAPSKERRLGLVGLFPAGLALFITPFNFPLNLVAHKVAPAIAIGAPFILKPAPQAPLTALTLAEIILESEFPPEGISVLTCKNEVAEQMVRDERVKIFSFTGSARVGWYLRAISRARKITLECGGNAAVVIDDDIDEKILDLAVERCIYGAFAYAGQICISVQRIFIQEKIYQEFKEKFVAAAKRVKVGDPLHPDTDLSVLINDDAAEKTAQRLQRAAEQGATFALEGTRQGKLFTPFILENATNDMEICQEEVFAPIAVLLPYKEFDEALRLVNESRYGLQAGIFTTNFLKIMQAFNTLEVGSVIINDTPTYRHNKMPYGGVKDSGLGREGPRYAMLEMSEPRLLILNADF